MNPRNNKGYHSRKYMEEGKRNLEKLHMLIGELRAKNKLKPAVQIVDMTESKPVNRYKNYLEEVKQSRVNNGQQDTIDYDRIVQVKDHDWVRM